MSSKRVASSTTRDADVMEASDADSAPKRGAPGSLTASLRAVPASPSRGVAPLARRTAPRDAPEEPVSAVETLSCVSAEAADAPKEVDEANASIAGDATRASRDVPAGPPPAASPAAPPTAAPALSAEGDISALPAENARLRAELDATSAALADAVASRFAAERALDVASRTHTHYGRMASGRAVTVTREVADDLRNAIEDQRRETQTLRRDHERATRRLADARRAHAVELAALREALDDAIAETARANMERDVARLKRLDEDEAEQTRKNAPDAPLSPRARAVVDALREREREASQNAENALNELEQTRTMFEAFRVTSAKDATTVAETHAAELAEWRAGADAEIGELRVALEDASREARAAKDALRHLEASSSERDELLAETLLTHEQLEIELDRATRALRRRGALVPTREAEAARLRDAEDATARASSAEEEGEASAERVAALEARVRRLTKQAHAAVQTHERATASLLAEHAAVLKQRDADAKRLGASLEAETVAAARARRRAAAFEKALRSADATAAAALAAATDAEEGILASLSVGDPVSRVVFSVSNTENTENTNRVGEGKKIGSGAARAESPSPLRKSPGKTFPNETSTSSRGSPLTPKRARPDPPAKRSLAMQTRSEAPERPGTASGGDDAPASAARDPKAETAETRSEALAPSPTPLSSSSDSVAIQARLRALESRVESREKHWAGVLREVHAAHAEETARAKRACVAAVETKNAQIRTFREKLNALAAAAHERRLRESGIGGGEETFAG